MQLLSNAMVLQIIKRLLLVLFFTGGANMYGAAVKCCVCFDHIVDDTRVFLPCSHSETCSQCIRRLDPALCPLCRVPLVVPSLAPVSVSAQEAFFAAAGDQDNGIAYMAAYLAAGGNINVFDADGLNAFMYATDVHAYENAAWLLDQGINIAVTDDEGRTCLMYAVLAGERGLGLLKRLLASDTGKATVPFTTYERGETALSIAVDRGNAAACRLLRGARWWLQ